MERKDEAIYRLLCCSNYDDWIRKIENVVVKTNGTEKRNKENIEKEFHQNDLAFLIRIVKECLTYLCENNEKKSGLLYYRNDRSK